MKNIIILGGVVVGLMIVGLSTYDLEQEVVIKEVSTEVHPEWATDTEAVEAAQAVIRRKELEAEENRLQGEIEALQSELDEVQKELGNF